ncbi:MAG: nucleoside triphosphate pyrophosphohydrolase [Magnetococcales bacterium]|nr:nucleoside triphosphate pyrophosphohydrolase [Magnetococcales bacterium]
MIKSKKTANNTTVEAMLELAQVMARLRSEDGCPWDRKQTWHSLIPYTIEEAYEVVEAAESGNPTSLKDELGDLLFHVVFYSRIAEENGLFDIADVITGITEKMVRRHPHVFSDKSGTVKNADEVPGLWEEIKRQEREEKNRTATDKQKDNGKPVSIFDDINSRVPALLWASKVQRKMGQVGFDWSDADGVVEKVHEEIEELEKARKNDDHAAMVEEIGDTIFTMVNLSRHLKINPETALRQATHKFQNRFRFMEAELHNQGRSTQDASLEELEKLWQESKTSKK